MKLILTSILVPVFIVALSMFFYIRWGRMYIYNTENVSKTLPGFGQFYGNSSDGFILLDDQGVEINVSPSEIEKYDRSKYLVTYIPAQRYLGYSVGYFEGWENIENSEDKYLLLQDNQDKSISKYRIIFDPDFRAEKRWSETVLQTENVGLNIDPGKSTLSTDNLNFRIVGFDKVKKVFQKRDVVIILPSRVEADLSAKDQSGNVLAESVIVRRVFGMSELNFELGI